MFGFTDEQSAIRNAAEFLLSKQSEAGDIRGIYGNQYSPNYTAAIIELLTKAGYDSDVRILKAFDWLLTIRQNDGGWAIPLRTQGYNTNAIDNPITIEQDKSKPFSHLITGVVLRAFAAHSYYRNFEEAQRASAMLADRFFLRDVYPDRNRTNDWTRFSFPFWWTDLISSLDTLSKLGFTPDHPNIKKAVEWLLDRQKPGGTSELHLLKDRYHDLALWIIIAICRDLKQMFDHA